MITDLIPKLQGHIPDNVLAQIPGVLSFGIDGPKRLANFLGQCKHESGSFHYTEENLHYSAAGLLKVFKKYFPSQVIADQYANQPDKIASRVYANRMGNGDEASGEGYKYRGRGYLQITGKVNYKLLKDALGVDLLEHPELVATTYALASAGFFFKNNSLWTICDQGTDTDTITALTKRINGGTNGLQERITYTQEFYKILTT